MTNVDDPTPQLRAGARAGDADASGAVFPDFADDVSGRLDDTARIKALHRALAGLPGSALTFGA